MAKALSISLNIPLIAVNHLKGHIYSLFIEKEEILPILVLLVSGGHTQLIDVKSFEDMKILATTIDDSFGESFDKVSKMLNLGYPVGPIVQEYALKGNPDRFDLPVPLSQSPKIEFSYSGLKNAVRLQIEKLELENENDGGITLQDKYDICASFQKTAVLHIMQKVKKLFKSQVPKNFAIVGGASANIYLRKEIEELCKINNTNLFLSDLKYCSDNAAMIGRVAVKQYQLEDFKGIADIDVKTRVREF
jgi:N6-L-threonylcarbamoyladenine synthase